MKYQKMALNKPRSSFTAPTSQNNSPRRSNQGSKLLFADPKLTVATSR